MTRARRLMSHFDLVQYSITALVQYSKVVRCSNIGPIGPIIALRPVGAVFCKPITAPAGYGGGR